MPSLGVYFPEDEIQSVEAAAASSDRKISAYIAEATRQRMEREGMMPGTTAEKAMTEARQVLELFGADALLEAAAAVRQRNLAADILAQEQDPEQEGAA